MMILLPILVWVNLIGLNSFYVLQKKEEEEYGMTFNLNAPYDIKRNFCLWFWAHSTLLKMLTFIRLKLKFI